MGQAKRLREAGRGQIADRSRWTPKVSKGGVSTGTSCHMADQVTLQAVCGHGSGLSGGIAGLMPPYSSWYGEYHVDSCSR